MKVYESPKFEYLKIDIIEDVLSSSNPPVGPDIDDPNAGLGEDVVPKETIDGDDLF
ncbi:MAG: hypothetical protein ACI4HO_10750 [Ruminococcus sp.]